MSSPLEPVTDADNRAQQFAQHADLGWVAGVLVARRNEILERWLAVARAQPFHAGKPERAVADHIPELFDAVVEVLRRSAPRWLEPEPLLEDPDIVRAAKDHARVRFGQGLKPAEVVTEFRLLRQEIGRALRLNLVAAAPAGDVLAAELLVHDALDGAVGLALAALTRHIEEVREDFLATTLHDVEQPLTAIKGHAQLAIRRLSRMGPAVGPVFENLRSVESEANRMTRMLAGLVDASRLALGQFELRRSRVDLRDLVREAADRLPPEHAGRVRFEAPEGPVVGEWDRDLLERVLDNVLSNAAKYSPPESGIEVSLQAEPDAAQLAVHDRGIGVAADEIDQVFERYRRAREAVEQGIRGQGLGLHLARSVVEAHGGRMWLESPGPGFGATVFVHLPRRATSSG